MHVATYILGYAPPEFPNVANIGALFGLEVRHPGDGLYTAPLYKSGNNPELFKVPLAMADAGGCIEARGFYTSTLARRDWNWDPLSERKVVPANRIAES